MPDRPRVDFDALLAALGEPNAGPPPQVEQLLADIDPRSLPPPARPPEPPFDPHDTFAKLEADLRARDGTRQSLARAEILGQLETWLNNLGAAFKGR